jgi:hypothetical protein
MGNAHTREDRNSQQDRKIPWRSPDTEPVGEHKHDIRSHTIITGINPDVTESRLTYEDYALSSAVEASERKNTPVSTNEFQTLISRNNNIDSEIKALQEKNLILTATVARLEKLITTIQCNTTTTKAILKDTVDTMAMLAMEGSASDQAIEELRSTIIPTMRQEFADKVDNLYDNIDNGFSSIRTMFERFPTWKTAPTVESQTTTTVQDTTYLENSLHCANDDNDMIDVTNKIPTTDHNKNKTTKPRKVLTTREHMIQKDDKRTENSSRQHKERHSISTRGDSKRDVTGEKT